MGKYIDIKKAATYFYFRNLTAFSCCFITFMNFEVYAWQKENPTFQV
jgi:hypothetical protein